MTLTTNNEDTKDAFVSVELADISLIVRGYKPEPYKQASGFRLARSAGHLMPDEMALITGKIRLVFEPGNDGRIPVNATCVVFIDDYPLVPVELSTEHQWDTLPITRGSCQNFSCKTPILQEISSYSDGEPIHTYAPKYFDDIILFLLDTDDVEKYLPERTTFVSPRKLEIVRGRPLMLDPTTERQLFTLRKETDNDGREVWEFRTDYLLLSFIFPQDPHEPIQVKPGKWGDDASDEERVSIAMQLKMIILSALPRYECLRDRIFNYVDTSESDS